MKKNKQIDQKALSELHTIADFLRYAMTRFESVPVHYGHGTDNAWDEALQLILFSLHLPINLNSQLLQARLLNHEKEMLLERIHLRTHDRIPVGYITGEAWFAGLPFFVDRNVLVPRSPLAELITARFAPWIPADWEIPSILEIGTGSGCIACTCAFVFPEAEVDAVDVSKAALAVADSNLFRHRLHNRVTLIESDVFSALDDKRYNIIISNPPYVNAPEMAALPPEYLYEPQLGLKSGDDGLDCVRKILKDAKKHLERDGLLIVEVGNSAPALIEAYPNLPFIWVDLTSSAEGVFILHAKDLP